MDPLDLMLVGCGLMGTRHLRGYGELEHARPGSLRLRAVCDPRVDAAEAVAKEAEALLGYRPTVCAGAEQALAAEPGIVAADVVTDNRSHQEVAIPLLAAGLNVQVEKPLAVTIARAQRIIDAAHEHSRVLAVAENNRRDPMNRLLQHVVQSGLVGEPSFVTQLSFSANLGVYGTPWRHDLAQGGLALDVGIHLGYILEYLLGEVDTLSAVSRQVYPTRSWTRPDGETETVSVESDDVFAATVAFKSGVQGLWAMHFGVAGAGPNNRTVFGHEGTATGSGDRSGGPVRVQRGREILEGEALVEALPDYRLNDIETRLFGERPTGYAYPGPETDRKLIAAETADFLDAVRDRRAPEVQGEVGLRSVALVYGVLESAAAGVPVELDEVVSGSVNAFQGRVEQAAASAPAGR